MFTGCPYLSASELNQIPQHLDKEEVVGDLENRSVKDFGVLDGKESSEKEELEHNANNSKEIRTEDDMCL